MEIKNITLKVNGTEYQFSVGNSYGQVPERETLSETLRNRLGLTGLKESCNEGACGCCTVIMGGDAVTSCMLLTVDCDGADVTTIEGLEDRETGKLDPIQQSFIDHYSFQCGFCTPGIIMSAKALFMKNPSPTKDEIADALSGNYCRCISHYHVFDALTDMSAKAAQTSEKAGR